MNTCVWDKACRYCKRLLPAVKLLLLWLAANVLAAIISGIVFAPFRPYENFEEYSLFLGQLLTGFMFFFFASTAFGVTLKELVVLSWKDKLKSLKIALKYFYIYLGFFILLLGAATGVLTMLDNFSGEWNSEIINGIGLSKDLLRFQHAYLSFPKFAVLFLGSCVFAPVIEEFFYRFMLFVELRKVYKLTGSLVFSSLVFASFHGNIVLAFISGAYFAYVYEKEKSLPVNIVLHALMNLFGLMLMGIIYHMR